MKNRYLIYIISFLIGYTSLHAENKYAFLSTAATVSAIQDDDEKAAAEWFSSNYTSGSFIPVSQIKANQVNLSEYDVIWIHIDNTTGEIPADFKDTQVLNSIKSYYQNGGNLLLSIHATHYLADLGRINQNRKPTIIGIGNGASNEDVWGINPNIGMTYNYSSHPIYSMVTFSNDIEEHPIIPLLTAGHKEDHNCMWDLNAFGYAENVVDAFEQENTATVLGTWGQVTDFCCAGLVEFNPTSQYKGKCIAIGLGAYEWAQNSGTNGCLKNIKQLTQGIFEYLSETENNNPGENGSLSLAAHFPLELNSDNISITEKVSNKTFTVNNSKSRGENMPGAVGKALRFDGFSTYVNATFNQNLLNDQALSATLWCAMESYPMMAIDAATDNFTFIAGNMKDAQKSGFAFVLNAHGKYGFEIYINGSKITCHASDVLPKYEWAHLSAVVSVSTKTVKLYRNNRMVGRTYFTGNSIDYGTRAIIIGKSYDDVFAGPFLMNTINGLVDDIRIYAGEIDVPTTAPTPENIADLSIPTSRFENEIQRPVFHGMPAANWTNEPHGLVYYNNKYHLFFQKNANGCYLSHQHWGHIVSDNLITWREEKPAITPDDWYDTKGAWSGCVFTDDELTGGKPHIFYTAVDFGRASIAEAAPLDDNLIEWKKAENNPIIAHRPDGLNDDFRDPVMFKAHGKYFIIVGSKKDGKGVATLHEYNPSTKTWSNDGRLFYQASNVAYGEFWEMPAVAQMDNNKWLFAATPLGARNGVEVLYWVGTINADGTFSPFSHTPKELELSNMSKDGFGLLSPSIMKKDGKTIAIGIVPDKLGGHDNYNLGWAHTFSLPREWSLDANNNLIQKPYEGLKEMRIDAETFTKRNFNLTGSTSLEPVNGMETELIGEFVVSANSSQRFGFNVRKSGEEQISIYYQPKNNKFTVDARTAPRLSNDGWIYNGLYESTLPEALSTGETMKMHIFIDHSIMDIFINDKWAFSIRIFPTDKNAISIEAFSEGMTEVKSIEAWNLNVKKGTATSSIVDNEAQIQAYFTGEQLHLKNVPGNAKVMVYDKLGRCLTKGASTDGVTDIFLPEKQVYIIHISTKNRVDTLKVSRF